MARVVIEVLPDGLMDVRVDGQMVSRDMPDLYDVAYSLQRTVDLPCEAEVVEPDGYRRTITLG